VTSASTASPPAAALSTVQPAVAAEARSGLLAHPRTLSAWLFYDQRGSELFEQITALPEYFLTRTERSIFAANASDILDIAAAGQTLTLLELGAGTAAKTGILLSAAVRRQGGVLYQPVDVSPSALAEATANIEASIPGVTVRPQVANYTAEPLTISRPRDAATLPSALSPVEGLALTISRPRDAATPADARVLALYIGSSIGNFAPSDAVSLLSNLRAQLRAGDCLLLGVDLAPGPHKSVANLLSAYDDAAGVTAAFNRNILTRLNRDLGADFNPACFAHRALWNADHSRIEMHLESLTNQQVHIPANAAGPAITFALQPGETIHTENSYKFTEASVDALLKPAGFAPIRTWQDPQALFAVTLATAA